MANTTWLPPPSWATWPTASESQPHWLIVAVSSARHRAIFSDKSRNTQNLVRAICGCRFAQLTSVRSCNLRVMHRATVGRRFAAPSSWSEQYAEIDCATYAGQTEREKLKNVRYRLGTKTSRLCTIINRGGRLLTRGRVFSDKSP